MKLDEKTLRKLFPNLARELESTQNRVSIASVRTDAQTGENKATERDDHYQPDVIDFIRRCDTKEQAEEIIDYMEKKGEIEKPYAERLRNQLKEKGVRSFGSRKENNYYFKNRNSKKAKSDV
ncbi:MAG: DUF2095 family protein [Candidatus Bathyarchaeota archaeon]